MKSSHHSLRGVTKHFLRSIAMLACISGLFQASPVEGRGEVLDLTVMFYDRFEQRRVERELSLELKSRAERRQLLADIVWHERAGGESFLLPRPGFTAEQLDAAREHARANLRDATLATLKVRPLMHQSYRNRYFDYLQRLLVLAGEAPDAALILENYCSLVSSKPHWEGRQIVNFVAQLESRLGTLRSGELVKILANEHPFASKQNWGVDAAIQLHRRGIDIGTEVLLSHLTNPLRDEYQDYNEGAAWALLAMDDPQVLTAMRNMFRTLVTRYGALDPNVSRFGGMDVPSVLHLLTYGDEEDVAALTANKLSLPLLMWLTPLVEDSRSIIRLLVRHGRYNMNLHLARLPEEVRQEIIDEVLQVVEEVNPNYKSATCGLTSPFWPSRETAHVYTTSGNWSPPWIRMPEQLPGILMGWHGDTRQHNPTYEAHLPYYEHAFLTEQIEAQCGDSWKAVLDSYCLLHGLAAPSAPQNLGFLPDNLDYEPFGLRHVDPESRWSGVVVGRVSYTAHWIDDKLVIGLGIRYDGDLVATATNTIDPETRKRFDSYLERDGRGLLESLMLRQNGRVVPLVATGKVRDGFFIYEAEPPGRNFAETYLDAVLRFFDQDRLVRFALYRGQAAHGMERAITREETAKVALEAAPEAGIDRRIDYAEALADKGQISRAWEIYRQAIDAEPSLVRSWQLAARMYQVRHLHQRAITVLREATDRNPDQIVLWRELARALYMAGDYPACLDATGKVLALDPGNAVATYREGACLLMAGRAKEAGERLGRLPAGFAVKQIGLLRYLATSPNHPDAADKALDNLRESLVNDEPGRELCGMLLGEAFDLDAARRRGEAHACRSHYYAGYRCLLDGDPGQARTHFKQAIATHRNTLIEYRLAEAALR